MKHIAVIPARMGSQGLPFKNRMFFDQTTDFIESIDWFDSTLVSTDDPEIEEIAKKSGALVPWLRPSELATDTASSVDVCLHALEWYEERKYKVDGLMLLQPTSPFRRRNSILRGIELFRSHHHSPVIGVSSAKSHPMWCFKIEGETMKPFIEDGGLNLRSQDLPPAYAVNGAFYLISSDDLRKRKSFFSENMVPLVIDAPEENLDIDTEWDWKLAEAILQTPNLAPPKKNVDE